MLRWFSDQVLNPGVLSAIMSLMGGAPGVSDAYHQSVNPSEILLQIISLAASNSEAGAAAALRAGHGATGAAAGSPLGPSAGLPVQTWPGGPAGLTGPGGPGGPPGGGPPAAAGGSAAGPAYRQQGPALPRWKSAKEPLSSASALGHAGVQAQEGAQDGPGDPEAALRKVCQLVQGSCGELFKCCSNPCVTTYWLEIWICASGVGHSKQSCTESSLGFACQVLAAINCSHTDLRGGCAGQLFASRKVHILL